MMDDTTRTPNDPTPMQELSETLRPAVEQVRAAAPPADAVDRSMDRAQRLGPPWRRRSRRWQGYCAAAAIAAAVLVAFGLWPNQQEKVPEPLAVALKDPSFKNVTRTKPRDAAGPRNELERMPDGSTNSIPFEKTPSKDAHLNIDPITEQRLKASDKAPFPAHPEGYSNLESGTGRSRSKDDPKKSSPTDNQPSMLPKPAPADSKTETFFTKERPNLRLPSSGSTTTAPMAGPGGGRDLNRSFQGQGNMGNGGIAGFGGRQSGQILDPRGYGMMGMGGMGMRGGMSMMGGMGMMGGMMGMRGGMAGGSQGVPTTSQQAAIKTAQAYRDFHKKQKDRLSELATSRAIEQKVVEEQVIRLKEAEQLVDRLQQKGTPSQPSQVELYARLKETVRKQELALNKTIVSRTKNADLARRALRETQEDLKTFELRLEGLRKQGNNNPEKKEPQVWHRDRSRPTFARVYIGDGNALELVSLHVSVTIEGPRARTVVDHIFRNPHNQQLEGTFEYPLPSGASPSYFAMFLGQTRATMPVLFGRRGDNAPLPAEALARLTPEELVKQVDTADWGRLQEARIVSKQKALETYEEVVRGRIDPALLEYAGGNTFSGRVFPIPPKGYNRVVLAYEELLPFAQQHMIYRFPLPNCKLNELQFNLQAKAAECLQPSFQPKDAKKETNGGRITFARTWKDSKPEGEAVFACTPANADVQAISGRQDDNGPRYVYARLRPALKTVAKDKPFASHAAFLLDTSLSEHPERFAVNMKLLQKILETDKDIKQFNILTFNVGAAWLEPKGFFENTTAGREKALKKLDGLVLEGATDISCALEKLAAPGFDLPAPTPLNVFLLSDGHVTWGEPDVPALVARFEQNCPYPTRFHCYRTGLGEENSELFETLTRKGGGVFQCYGEAELEATAKAHRSQCLQVKQVRFVGGPAASDILVSGRRAAVYPGGELVVAARCNGAGRTTVLVEGEFAGQKVVQEFPLEVRSGSELAPRAWAEVAVASLLALHDSNFDPLVTAYCQQFGIVSRVASFLVLENEADYKRFNLEAERGRTVAGDLGAFITEAWTQLGKRVPAAKAFERFLTQVNQRVNLLNGPEGAHVKQVLAVLTEEDFQLPAGSIRGGIIYRKDVAGYLEARERDRRNVSVYLTEARRRAEADDVAGAVRVLSSLIEEYPSRGDALRLVGYRLLDLQQPAQAARLFSQVQKQRPFEPHSYRDLAHALESSGQHGLAAINYEIVLAGTWHNRFRQELKVVAMEEYAHMMQEAIRHKQVSNKLANLFGERLEQMRRPQPKSDLRVTISWNTDATDVDLWVIEPDGTKCFYSHNRTSSGGELSQDQTQGYGPERYQIAKAQPGVYTVLVHYFRPNPNLLGGETHVSVKTTRFAGTPQEATERHTVILKKHNQQVEVCKIKF